MNRNILHAALLGSTLLILPTACSGGDDGDDGGNGKVAAGTSITTLEVQPSDPPALKEAKQTFKTLCTVCHGPSGKGDGPGAPPDPKPRSFADDSWQASVTDEHIRKVIVGGGAAVGKSAMMPPNPQLKGKSEVVNHLVEIVRYLGQQD